MRSKKGRLGVIRIPRGELIEAVRAAEEEARELEQEPGYGQDPGYERDPQRLRRWAQTWRETVLRPTGVRKRAELDGSPSLGAHVEVRNLLDVLGELLQISPGMRLRELDPEGFGEQVWDLEDLYEVVRADLTQMTPAERAQADVNRYFWGFDREGLVEVVHAPIHAPPYTQFQEF